MEACVKAKGIRHRSIVPFNPAQNGVAERFNRTIMERDCAQRLAARLPKKAWGESVKTAACVRNMSPVAQYTKTPWELFFGQTPDVSGLRVFGSTAYVQVPRALRRKLDAKSVKVWLVGCQGKAYRELQPGNKIVVSQDILFDADGASKHEDQQKPHAPSQPARYDDREMPGLRQEKESDSEDEKLAADGEADMTLPEHNGGVVDEAQGPAEAVGAEEP
jgi:hypothetical protein